jgi:hypothetical protein
MLKEHDTWSVIDSTKLKTYAACPRKYFYEYVLGWRPDLKSNHLVFGAAWHKGMEVLMADGYGVDAVKRAYTAFEEEYRKEYPDYTDDEMFPKTPYMAARAYAAYAETFGRLDTELHTIHTEIAGSVPLLDNKRLRFKMDTIMLNSVTGLYESLEHKTGSRLSKPWIDGWKTDIQTGAYQHVLNCVYSPDAVWGIRINGVFFQSGVKKAGEVKFERVPVRRNLQMMEDWLLTVMGYIYDIERDTEQALVSAKNRDTMQQFRKNPTNCAQYGTCQYLDFCITWPNPVHYADEVPIGFKVEYWDPRSAEDTATVVVNV